MSDVQELRWSAQWAEVVGPDGPVITDILGLRVPCLTVRQRDELRCAYRDRWPVDSRVTPSLHGVWETADRNGLRTVLACAIQSVDRAIRTHITGPVGSGDWHLWVDLEEPLHRLMQALVLRRIAAPMAVLAGPWEAVMGELPPLVDLAPAESPRYCLECLRPLDARLVTEAEAQRHALALHDSVFGAARAAYEREDAMRRRMNDWQRDYVQIAYLQEALECALGGQVGQATPFRHPVADRVWERLGFGIRPATTPNTETASAAVEQPDLFEVAQ